MFSIKAGTLLLKKKTHKTDQIKNLDENLTRFSNNLI
jgi:hypothetical protein